MNTFNQKISEIGVVPVIKLNHPERDAAGLAKIKALSAPFPMFKVMPTGGINLKNLKEYLSAPVIAACGGSYMTSVNEVEAIMGGAGARVKR